jgi:hypothetical protein
MVTFDKIMEYSPENEKVFEKLSALCTDKEIVPFVGAGLSVFAGLVPILEGRNLFPTWEKLTNDLINDDKYKEYFKNKKLPENSIDAAEKIEKKIGKENFYEHIRVTMGGDLTKKEWGEILKNAENQAISFIPKLFFGPILTTNFDRIIEYLYIEKKHNKNLPVAFPYHTKILVEAIGDKKQFLYKIHGCVFDAQNIVLTREKYDEIYRKDGNKYIVEYLRKLYKGFHFLFLGCSLNISEGTIDESIKVWLDLQEKSLPHYAIIECKENATKDEIKARRKELEKEHIFPILYKHKEYSSVKMILKELLSKNSYQPLRVHDTDEKAKNETYRYASLKYNEKQNDYGKNRLEKLNINFKDKK